MMKQPLDMINLMFVLQMTKLNSILRQALKKFRDGMEAMWTRGASARRAPAAGGVCRRTPGGEEPFHFSACLQENL